MKKPQINLNRAISRLEKAQAGVSEALATIGCLLQDSRSNADPRSAKYNDFYGSLVMNLLESEKIESSSLGAAFFVLGKCDSDLAFQRFVKFLILKLNDIKDEHAIGNAVTTLENHFARIDKRSMTYELVKLLLDRVQQLGNHAWNELLSTRLGVGLD